MKAGRQSEVINTARKIVELLSRGNRSLTEAQIVKELSDNLPGKSKTVQVMKALDYLLVQQQIRHDPHPRRGVQGLGQGIRYWLDPQRKPISLTAPLSLEDQIVLLVTTSSGLTQEEIRKRLDITQGGAGGALKRLEDKGSIHKKGGFSNGIGARWYLGKKENSGR